MQQARLTLLVLTFTVGIIGYTHKCAAETFHILCLLPYPQPHPDYNPSWSEGPPISLALDMAKEHVNNRTDILPGHKIELIHADCGCDFTTRAFVSFTSNVYSSGYKIVGVIGPGCSSSALALAPVSNHEGVSIVSVHGGGSPLLSNRGSYYHSLGSLGSSEGFVNVSLRLMEKSGWRKVAILFDEARIFYSSTRAKLIERIAEIDGGEVKFESPVYDYLIPLSVIRDERLRVVFIFTPPVTTRMILCLAFHLGYTYPTYQYIVSSNTYADLAIDVTFVYQNRDYYCSKSEMINVTLEGVTFLNYRLSPFNTTLPTTYSRISFEEYNQLLTDKIEAYNMEPTNAYVNISNSVWSTYFYDSLWAWSVVLDRITRTHPDFSLTDYDYGNTTLSDIILDEFYSLDFEGVSGTVKFIRNTGFLNRAFDVFQVVNSTLQVVAYYNQEVFDKIGPLQYIPDRFENLKHNSHIGITVVFVIIEIVQGVVVIVLHALSIKYRNYHSIKASSPKLNHLIFIGTYIFVVAMLLGTLQSLPQLTGTFAHVACNAIWPWLYPIAFTLTFGTVAARTWRLYRIFTHYLNPGRLISNKVLIAFISFLLFIDVIIGTVWLSTDPLLQREEVFEHNETIQIVTLTCSSNNFFVWFGIVVFYKVSLLVSVMVLAFLTRNIQNLSFTTKSLRVLVYLFSATFIIGFLTYYVFQVSMPLSDLDYVILYATLNIMLFLYNTLVFLPPLLPLLRGKLYKRFPFLNKTYKDVQTNDEDEGGSKFYV